MKTGIVAALAIGLAACSGQVVTQSPTAQTGAALGGYGICIGPPPCFHVPCPNGSTKCNTQVTAYYAGGAYQDSSFLSPEEQKVEAQMEAELDAEIATNAAAAAQQSAHR
jgi:hypothetical protein